MEGKDGHGDSVTEKGEKRKQGGEEVKYINFRSRRKEMEGGKCTKITGKLNSSE